MENTQAVAVARGRDDDEILTIEDVERIYQLKPGTQKSLRARGKIPFHRLGSRIIRYRRSELAAWLNAAAVKPKVNEPARMRCLGSTSEGDDAVIAIAARR